MRQPAEEHHLIRRHFGEDRSLGDRVADRFVSVFGSWSYIIWQTATIITWMVLNVWFLTAIGSRVIPDPYPFILLNLGFSAQASYAAPLILMAQNRQAVRDKDFAAHQFHLIERVDQSTGELVGINRQQLQILQELRALRADVEGKP